MSDWRELLHVFTTPFGPAGVAILIYAVFLYSNLSRRLGAVTKMPAYYRWFFVGGAFWFLSLIVSVVRGAASLSSHEAAAMLTTPESGLYFAQIPLLIGTIVNVIVVWKYWSWLIVGEKS